MRVSAMGPEGIAYPRNCRTFLVVSGAAFILLLAQVVGLVQQDTVSSNNALLATNSTRSSMGCITLDCWTSGSRSNYRSTLAARLLQASTVPVVAVIIIPVVLQCRRTGWMRSSLGGVGLTYRLKKIHRVHIHKLMID